MPSGTLWRVMAAISSVLWRRVKSMSFARRRWGRTASNAERKPTPSSSPAAAGSQPGTPKSADCSMAGSSRLQTLAAVITPAAKPSIVRWNWGRGSSTKKNTTAAPKVVIRKVKPVPKAAQLNACSIRINAFSSIQAEFCLYASIGDNSRMCADGVCRRRGLPFSRRRGIIKL